MFPNLFFTFNKEISSKYMSKELKYYFFGVEIFPQRLSINFTIPLDRKSNQINLLFTVTVVVVRLRNIPAPRRREIVFPIDLLRLLHL